MLNHSKKPVALISSVRQVLSQSRLKSTVVTGGRPAGNVAPKISAYVRGMFRGSWAIGAPGRQGHMGDRGTRGTGTPGGQVHLGDRK